jgi:hypothetical protein
LIFSPVGDRVRITCVSRTSWVLRPEVEVCELDELPAMCVRLAHDFAAAFPRLAPSIAGLAPFDRWLRGDV